MSEQRCHQLGHEQRGDSVDGSHSGTERCKGRVGVSKTRLGGCKIKGGGEDSSTLTLKSMSAASTSSIRPIR